MDSYTETLFITDVYAALRHLEFDVQQRNQYMNRRDDYVYGNGLWTTLEIPTGFDHTLYNFLPRVVDIHSSQLMGRNFQIYSTFNKDDLSVIEESDPKYKIATLTNKRKAADADARKRYVDAIIRDNGGFGMFKNGARIGSVYGETVYKMWWDDEDKKIRINLLESPQNYRAGWADTNFRERDFDAYVYQISLAQANRLYSDKLKSYEEFNMSPEGQPFADQAGNGLTSDPLGQQSNTLPIQTRRKMVTVVDLTGYMEGWKTSKAGIEKADRGKESKLSIMLVGGRLVQTIKEEKLMPRYYILPNRVVPRRAWGDSDLPDSALDINATYMERMSDYITLVNKTIFPMYQMKGFDPASMPRKKQRQMLAVSMTQDQSIETVSHQQVGFEYDKLLHELKDAFVRVTGVGRVLFDDPSISPDSNQALMTTLKGVIDIVEDKQARWGPFLTTMFTDCLELASQHVPEMKDIINIEEDWYFYVEWPSVLRREDASYQQIWLNLFNAGVISVETYLEKLGIIDVSEELDRIRDNMKDPVSAAILGKQLGEMAHMTLNKALGIPPWGYVVPKVMLRGDLTPQQEANMAENYQWNEGPYGSSIGPQGMQGTAANDNVINQGFINGDAFSGGMPAGVTPGKPIQPQQPNPTLTPDQNQPGQTASQPGSGQPQPVSPAGAVAQLNQRRGA